MYQAANNMLGTEGMIAGLPWRDQLTLFTSYDSGSGTGTAYNLTGCTGRFALRSLGSTGALLLEGTTANAAMVLGGVAGTVVIDSSAISPAHAAIPEGVHAYCIEIFSSGGVLLWYIDGQLEFRRRV